MEYQITINGLKFEEAKIIYAELVGVPVDEIWGNLGMSWSGTSRDSTKIGGDMTPVKE